MQRNKSIIQDKTYDFSIKVIYFCKDLPNDKVYKIISDQLLRSATSIGANIIEAKGCSTKKDFAKFYQIALKSGNESEYWLNIVSDIIDNGNVKEKVVSLLEDLDSICRIIGKSLITMRS